MPPPSIIPSTRKRKLLPMSSAPPSAGDNPPSSPLSTESGSSPGAEEEEEDEYAPAPSKQRARKSKRVSSSSAAHGGGGGGGGGGGARGKAKSGADGKVAKTKGMSREALRKANHSLIERRRREKINAALGELRDMVPGLGDDGGKGGEFKLEVLERTVSYMKELKERIAELELAGAGSVAMSMSREVTATSGSDRHDGEHRRDTSGDMVINPHLSHVQTHDTHPGSGWAKTSPYPSPSPDQRHFHRYLSQSHFQPPSHSHTHHSDSHSHTHSPDPNETEVESNLPPPLARAGSRFSYSSSSASTRSMPGTPQENNSSPLLGSTHNGHLAPARTQPLPPPTRPPPPASSSNPIFLPFPAPSLTPPLLMNAATMSGTPSASTSATAPSEPSPFLPPLPNIGLFGGMLNLDASPQDTFRAGLASKHGSPPSLSLPESKQATQTPVAGAAPGAASGHGAAHVGPAGPAGGMGGGTGKHAPNSKANADMGPEEAANLLLAFSSPDTLRPQSESILSAMAMQQQQSQPQHQQQNHGRGRRMTLDNEEFSLDGGMAREEGGDVAGSGGAEREGGKVVGQRPIVGKSVKDILRLS